MMDRKEGELFSVAKQLSRAMGSFHGSRSGRFGAFFPGGARFRSELSNNCEKDVTSLHVSFAESRPRSWRLTFSPHVETMEVNTLASARSCIESL